MSDTVATRVRDLRKARGWQTGDLAARCAEHGDDQLTENVIENIESGRRDKAGRRRRAVTVDELFSLARALDCAPAYLLPGQLEPGSFLGPMSSEDLGKLIAQLQMVQSYQQHVTGPEA